MYSIFAATGYRRFLLVDSQWKVASGALMICSAVVTRGTVESGGGVEHLFALCTTGQRKWIWAGPF
eukprot:8876067-Prorocentrum_lima.AAC.1